MKNKIFKWISISLFALCGTMGTLLMFANSSHSSYRLSAGPMWAILLGVLLPLALLFLGLWFSCSFERGYPRHWRLISLIAAVWIVLFAALMLVLGLAPERIPSFYAKSRVGPHYSNSIALDVSVPQEMRVIDNEKELGITLGMDRTVSFAVGIGSSQRKNIRDSSDYAHLTVSAKGCTVGKQADAAVWEYEEFTTNPLYLATVEQPILGYDVLYPTYHDMVSITFPTKNTSGSITFELIEYYGEKTEYKAEYTDTIRVVLYYTVRGDWLTLHISEGTSGK